MMDERGVIHTGRFPWAAERVARGYLNKGPEELTEGEAELVKAYAELEMRASLLQTAVDRALGRV